MIQAPVVDFPPAVAPDIMVQKQTIPTRPQKRITDPLFSCKKKNLLVELLFLFWPQEGDLVPWETCKLQKPCLLPISYGLQGTLLRVAVNFPPFSPQGLVKSSG